MSKKVTVVMYHYIRDLAFSRFPEIKALLLSEFNEQIIYLKKNYSFITLDDCVNALYNKSDLPSNPCLLTFDDGYIDHFTNVFPILDKHKIQGCFFPPAKAILNHQVLGVNKIHFILASKYNNINDLVTCIFYYLDEYRSFYKLKSNHYYYNKLATKDEFDTRKVVFIKKLLQVELVEDLRKLIINDLFRKYVTKDEESFSRGLYMDLEHIKYMSQNGMYIGSHGYDHYWLDKLSSERQEFEVTTSLEFLQMVNAPTENWAFCYPYGAFNDSLISILKMKNCALGFTTKKGIANISNNNAYTLERLDTNFFPKN
jgi:peptidoglycan/xylan/chitin deacetylase (PgdA/CDA1 family)